MNGFWYGLLLQLKLDIRSKTLLITCYIVPLIFFLLIGGIFISVMPEMKSTLIQSMIVMNISMGAIIGLPPTLAETYGSDIQKVYKANGVPIYLGFVTIFLSTFVHLMISSSVIIVLAPLIFEANLPVQLPYFFLGFTMYIIVALGIGGVLGMFPIDLLPDFLLIIGRIFPASWGYQLMLDNGFCFENAWYLILILALEVILCSLLLAKQKSK